jgi:hypothetical protein
VKTSFFIAGGLLEQKRELGKSLAVSNSGR